MTPQERELLSTFLQQLKQTQAGLKDSEAEALIREACALQPDAAYLLVQRTMGLDFAVQAAQAQIDKLQAQTDKLQAELEPLRASAKPASSSFLDSPNVWGRQAAPLSPAPPAPASRPAMQPAAVAAAPVAQTPAPASAPASAWGSGILGSVATTAAGDRPPSPRDSPASKCTKPFLSVGLVASTSLLRATSRTFAPAAGAALAKE